MATVFLILLISVHFEWTEFLSLQQESKMEETNLHVLHHLRTLTAQKPYY